MNILNVEGYANLIGNLTADPEIFKTSNGRLARLRVAVSNAGRSHKSDSRTGFFNVTAFLNDDQDFLARQIDDGNLKKGSGVHIVANLDFNEYEDKDGNNRSSVGFICHQFSYRSGGGGSNGDNSNNSSSSSSNDSGSSNDEGGKVPPDLINF